MIIGIIGGGQLGLMMAEAAKKHNHKVIGIDPNPVCPLSLVADEMIISDYNSEVSFIELVEKCDVITYEFENVNLDLISQYHNKIPQGSNALQYSRDRLIEKHFASNLGIPVPKNEEYIGSNLFVPSIIKTTTGGYDGKGQLVVRNIIEIDQFEKNDNFKYIIEELIQFDYEISVVITRDVFGSEVVYPIPKNTHKNGILFISEVFNEIPPLIVSKAKKYTSKLVKKLNYVGTLAVEYFVRGTDVIFNEFAPRPHNSGHYTIEGCTVSQFENHILAITKERIENSTLIGPSIMINVLGQDNGFVERVSTDKTYYHNYGKIDNKYNRKMGHITIVSDTIQEAKTVKNNIIKESL